MRKFFKTTYTIDVLTEDMPLENVSLEDIAYEVTNGHASGGPLKFKSVELTAPTAAMLLLEQGSDPEFFGLDDNGNDLEES